MSNNFYDKFGSYLGRQDDAGCCYDANNNFLGRIDSNGNVYDSFNSYQGRITGTTGGIFSAFNGFLK